VCEAAGIGTTVFRQLFKRYYQKTPMEYITQLRLEHARNQISGGMPIELAAAESGFADPKYFARVVKKNLGCTPRDLKKYGK
jgi:AraC-like DNA-binding protein